MSDKHSPRERSMLYGRGFRQGAALRHTDRDCGDDEDYKRGYKDGMQAGRDAMALFNKEIGHVSSILREDSQ